MSVYIVVDRTTVSSACCILSGIRMAWESEKPSEHIICAACVCLRGECIDKAGKVGHQLMFSAATAISIALAACTHSSSISSCSSINIVSSMPRRRRSVVRTGSVWVCRIVCCIIGRRAMFGRRTVAAERSDNFVCSDDWTPHQWSRGCDKSGAATRPMQISQWSLVV